MSKDPTKKLRRNGSPSSKSGPIRATLQFGLTSPSLILNHRSPMTSPAHLKDRSKARSESSWRSPSLPATPRDKSRSGSARCNSFENLTAPYLSGQWPKDGQWQTAVSTSSTASFQYDKQTQTSEDWDESILDKRKVGSITLNIVPVQLKSQYRDRRSPQPSVPNTDQLKKDIKQKLQRSGNSQRITSSVSGQHPVAFHSASQPIPIKPQALTCGLRGTPGKTCASVEGLNQEVEKLIISGHPCEETKVLMSSVEGRKAPLLELLMRNANTQTPSQYGTALDVGDTGASGLHCVTSRLPVDVKNKEVSRSSSRTSSSSMEDEESWSESVSPSLPLIPGDFDLDDCLLMKIKDDLNRPNGHTGSSLLDVVATSPNFAFQRLPPDGAEKVKTVEELSRVPQAGSHFVPPHYDIALPSYDIAPTKCPLKPSERSAFRYLPVLHHRQDAARLSPRLVEQSH